MGTSTFMLTNQHTDARMFTDILSLFNLTQHINKHTYKLGNTLDLLISRKSSFLCSHKVDTQLSDHNNILFKRNMIKTPCPTKVVNFRKLKDIKLDDFKLDIKQATKDSIQINEVDVLVDYYNNELKNILDRHAPQKILNQKKTKKT